MEDTLRSQLQTLLAVERAMLEKWFKVQEAHAARLANDVEVRRIVGQVLEGNADAANADATPGAPKPADLAARLAKTLDARIATQEFVGFIVVDRQLRIVAADAKELLDRTVPQFEPFLSRALEGKTTVSPPFPSVVILKDATGKLRSSAPTMFACAPLRDENFQVVGVLAMRIRPEKEFTNILQLGRIGNTGETYAVNKEGTLVSNSRFDDQLILLGLLPDVEGAASILNIQVRDPGGSLVEGFRPSVRRRELPLTQIAAAVVSGTSGVNMEGYRGYRGALKVGAWSWLPEYDVGIITEIDMAEAYRPLTILKVAFFSMFALLTASAAAIFVFTLIVTRLQRQARKAAVEARQLGQYRLEEKIGAGAMGVVYRGQHAMLRRPTAIKLLDVERVDEASIERFEREVQITCNLNNPHTVAIYDYGRTPEGVFYYAMEFLDGIDLQKLVESYGPQPEGRVASILRQMCASLFEAHSQGLVHRDIKPSNVMLNRRGGEPDVVKVLDFGLVKALHEGKQAASHDLSGTPLYMSPEAIQTPESVDARSDLYAVGAVGYFLLTGQTAFSARTLAELCQQHLAAAPDAPSQKLGRAVSEALEHAILACLEKNRAKRPQTARDLAGMLERVTAPWTLDDAESWWSRHERALASPVQTNGPSSPFAQSPAAGKDGNSDGARASAGGTGTAPSGFDRTTLFDPPDDRRS
jgi:serine/threonine protein kinase